MDGYLLISWNGIFLDIFNNLYIKLRMNFGITCWNLNSQNLF
jgi:hypothetical protein